MQTTANFQILKEERSSAEGPREGPGVARMPVAAKTSSKRLGVPARAGCPF